MPLRPTKKESSPTSGGDDESDLPPPSKRLHEDDDLSPRDMGAPTSPPTSQPSVSGAAMSIGSMSGEHQFMI